MPITVVNPKTAGGENYVNVFQGPVDHPAQIAVDITALTDDEIDPDGYLKPGVPLSPNGTLITVATDSAWAAAVADVGNTGNATIDSLQGRAGKPTETITVTATVTGGDGVGKADVRGSKSGYLGEATVGTLFVSSVGELRIVDGSTDLTVGDEYTIAVTGGTSDRLLGVTFEPIKVADGNTAPLIAAASDAFELAVGIVGAVSRPRAEWNLGRTYTAEEIAAFPSSGLVLLEA
jgi:hypothetical protein